MVKGKYDSIVEARKAKAAEEQAKIAATKKIYTLKDEFISVMKENGESWDDVVSHTLTDEELNEHIADFQAFTLWTKTHVYFPGVYDSDTWVASVSRNPDGEATPAVGGG